MIRVNIFVEGQTEEGFVKNVLAHALRKRDMHARPILVPNTRGATRRRHRGGISAFEPVRDALHRNVRSDTGAYTTTLFDYYGLPGTFPGVEHPGCPPPSRLGDRVDFLEQHLAQVIGGGRRFIPYLQLHEFEALLFSDIDVLDREMSVLDDRSSSRRRRLRQITDAFDTPEDINDNPDTAPSKRLEALYPGYQKVPFGELIAESIGLDVIRDACPRFCAWLDHLEALDPLNA